jgi:hypothetical protein
MASSCEARPSPERLLDIFHVLRHSFISPRAAGVDQRISDDIVVSATEELRRRVKRLAPPGGRTLGRTYPRGRTYFLAFVPTGCVFFFPGVGPIF